MIDVYAKAGNIPKAEEWFSTLVASGAKLAANNFNTVINACAKGGDVERAEVWLADMKAKGFPPNVRSYTSVIDACAKVGAQMLRKSGWRSRRKATTTDFQQD